MWIKSAMSAVVGVLVCACCLATWGARADEIQRSGPLFDLLCKDKSPCQVQKVYDAGRSPAGVPLKVVEVGLHSQEDGGAERPQWEADDGSGAEPILCYTNTYWLVEESTPPRTEMILEVCNDGYGASGVGEDSIEVKPNRLIHDQNGGSAQRWSEHVVWQLVPLRVVEVGNGGYMTWNYEASQEFRWSWESFSGYINDSMTTCDADGMVTEGGALHEFKASLIPRLPSLPGDKGWKETGLGQCSVHVDSAGEGGFITYGKPGEAADATLRALLVGENVLYVEVSDDTISQGAAKWLHDDHIELWVVPKGALGYPDCLTPKSATVYQWGVMLDGAVHAAHGKPKDAPKVEVHKVNATTYRLRVELPMDLDALSVVYSDSDDGKSQERLLATSAVAFGEGFSLGRAQEVKAESPAHCVLKGSTLTPTFK
jgi:hypothetical protein